MCNDATVNVEKIYTTWISEYLYLNCFKLFPINIFCCYKKQPLEKAKQAPVSHPSSVHPSFPSSLHPCIHPDLLNKCGTLMCWWILLNWNQSITQIWILFVRTTLPVSCNCTVSGPGNISYKHTHTCIRTKCVFVMERAWVNELVVSVHPYYSSLRLMKCARVCSHYPSPGLMTYACDCMCKCVC